jgi:uncharacterized protein YndB with AHSA1/START domain
LWRLVCDPHHLPRWWPRVARVEDVSETAFTEVMTTSRGRVVRADFNVLSSDGSTRSLTWEQQLEGTPFAKVLSRAVTELRLDAVPSPAPAVRAAAQDPVASAGLGGETDVTIELRQSPSGFFPRFGGHLIKRAAAATINEALDGLERIGG